MSSGSQRQRAPRGRRVAPAKAGRTRMQTAGRAGSRRPSGGHARRQAHAAKTSARRPAGGDGRALMGISVFIRIFLVAAVIVLIGVAVIFISRYFDGSWRAKTALNDAISAVSSADEVIVPLNNEVTSTVDEITTLNNDSLTSDIQSATEYLGQAETKLAETNELDEFLDDNQRSMASALKDSIAARRTMISSGQEILAVDVRVGEARNYLEQAINKAVEADTKSREATQAANEYAKYLTGDTSVSVTDAQAVANLDNEAITLFNEAKTILESAKASFEEADYSLYEAYLDKRLEAAQLMLEADNALVSGDFASTSELTDKYNEADSAASEAAGALPTTTVEIFSEKYSELTQTAREEYTKAAAQAAEADAVIRHFQGVNVAASVASTTSATEASTTAAATTQGASQATETASTEASADTLASTTSSTVATTINQ